VAAPFTERACIMRCETQHAMMADYRRCRVPGGTYFFTVNLLNRRSTLLMDHIDLLRCAFILISDANFFHPTVERRRPT
jgi:hypothetical protein